MTKGAVSWSLDEFVEAVSIVGDDARNAVRSSGQGMIRETKFAAYHFRRVEELKDQMSIEGHDDPGRALMTAVAPELEGTAEKRVLVEQFASTAHLVAGLRALHASGDLVATMLYHAFALGGAPGRLPLRRAYPDTVAAAMQARGGLDSSYTALSRFIDLGDYRYVRALSNASKHREIVRAPYTISLRFDGSPSPHGLRVAEFREGSQVFPARGAEELTRGLHTRFVRGLLDVCAAATVDATVLSDRGGPA